LNVWRDIQSSSGAATICAGRDRLPDQHLSGFPVAPKPTKETTPAVSDGLSRPNIGRSSPPIHHLPYRPDEKFFIMFAVGAKRR